MTLPYRRVMLVVIQPPEETREFPMRHSDPFDGLVASKYSLANYQCPVATTNRGPRIETSRESQFQLYVMVGVPMLAIPCPMSPEPIVDTVDLVLVCCRLARVVVLRGGPSELAHWRTTTILCLVFVVLDYIDVSRSSIPSWRTVVPMDPLRFDLPSSNTSNTTGEVW